jgi:hypothetical protein
MTLPVVQARQASDEALVKKINDRLVFLSAEGNESQQFTVSRNDDRVLTIAFDNEGCGAYCENYNTYFSFDLKDGTVLTAANLFTPAGLQALSVRLRQEQITRYSQQLATLGKELKAARAKGSKQAMQDATSDLEERIELNQNCLEGQRSLAKEANGQQAPVRPFGNSEFEVAAKAFKLTAGRCSNHAMRALDDVGDVTLSLPYPTLAPWLSAYGRSVLLGEGSAAPAERVYGQLLRGTLGGKTAITMLLEKEEGDGVSGAYFYDKFRRPIALSGTRRGSTLELKEQVDDKPESDATLSLTISGDELRGQWASKAANKQFELRLAP